MTIRWGKWAVAALLLSGLLSWTAGADVPPPSGDAPRIVLVEPARGEELPIDGSVRVVFDRPMDRPSVEQAFVLTPTLGGTFYWTSDEDVRFVPNAPWKRGETYVVSVSGEARDASGLPLAEPLSHRVHVVGFLSVVQTSPADGTSEVGTDTLFTVFFNRPVVALAALSAPDTAPLAQPLQVEPAVDGTGQWIGTSVYVFAPSSSLRGGTTYTARIPAGLEDETGGLLVEDAVWTFTTVRPRTLRTWPEDGEDLVPLDAKIRVTFNMPMSAASAADRISVRPVSLFGALPGEPVSGMLEAEGNALLFVPTEPLEFDREYLVTLEPGLLPEGGGQGTEDFTRFRFRTVPRLRILGTSPRNGAERVSPYSPFVLEFNAPIDPESVLERITIEPTPAPGSVSGWFNDWDLRYVVYFDIQPSQTYTVRVAAGIQDPYGNAIDDALTVRFTTDRLDPVAWLHVPGSVGTYSSYEPARMVVAHRNTDRLDFTLTRLDVADYFEALTEGSRWDPPSRGSLREWTVRVSSPENEMGYTAVDLSESGGALRPGAYAIEVAARGVEWNPWQHRHVLVVTPTHLILKTTDEETLVWATDLESGQPVPGLILWAMNADGEPLDVDVTDSRGLSRFPGASSTDWRGLTILARSPFTLADSGWSDGISPWDFGTFTETAPEGRAYLDTDRLIYRTGQTVYFRALLRDEDDATYGLPTREEARITLTDPAWNTVYDEALPIDASGEVADEFALPEDAALGTYRLRVSFGEVSTSHSFEVAAYRAPEFEVTLLADTSEAAKGDRVGVNIEAMYFFGAPVSDASVEWRVLSEGYTFSPPAFGQYTFTDTDDPWTCWTCWWQEPTPSSPVLTGEGNTDALGVLSLQLPADVGSLPRDEEGQPAQGSRRLTIEATAAGRDGSSISGRTSVVIHQASFYAGLATERPIGRAGEEMPLQVITLDWAGERLPETSLKYEVYLREWLNTFEEDPSGGGRWSWTTRDTLVASGDLTTNEHGDGHLSFVPQTGGSFKVVVEGLDARERTTRTSLFVWVSGAETVAWRRANDDRVTLIADKTSYRAGEEARVLVPSPFPGEQWALVTVERSGILTSEVVLLPNNSSVLTIPLGEEHIPNVYVSVVLVQGRAAALASGERATAQMKVGYVSLAVDPEPKRLQISLTTNAVDPQPGDTIDLTLSVRDAEGEPVHARLAVDLVDKAVLTLQPREAERILRTFYEPRGLGVSTSSSLVVSLSRLVIEQLEDLGLVEEDVKYAMDGAVGAGSPVPMAASGLSRDEAEAATSSSLSSGITVREEFADTAYWNPYVETDGEGEAAIRVELPDNLTTWVARAVGSTTDTRVGEGTAEVLVTKPLLVRPVAPRFFVVGDRVRLAASVTNQTDAAVIAEVTLTASGISLETPAVQTMSVPARGEAQGTWWVRVLDVPVVDLVWTAVGGGYADSARPRLTTGPDGTLLVFRYTAPETVGTAGELRQGGLRTETVLLPEAFDPSRTQVDVRLETSLAAALQEGLTYLRHFEYECTEQVVSRFLPNALTYRALSLLGWSDPELAEPLADLVLEGLEKLYERQNSDGGWGWWFGESSNAHLTAYAAYALLRVRDGDIAVRESVLQDALDFLDRTLVPAEDLTAGWQANRQAWVLYVLSLGGENDAAPYARDLFAQREILSHYARALLAAALHRYGEPTSSVNALVADVTTQAILSATGAHWEERSVDRWAMNTDTRSTAIILDVLIELDSTNPLLPNVVRWLMVARKGGIWETTQENAWAIVALTDWMAATGELEAEYTYSVSWDGNARLSGVATPESVSDSATLSFAGPDLSSADRHRLTIERSEGPGVLYYTSHLSLGLPADQVDARSRGVVGSRQ
ncbi:MAG: Ig-like domain-containing protein [Candidatus Bipolaricaulota bacterium]